MNTGIIGGADGPTTIFITSSITWFSIIKFVVLLIAVVGIIIYLIKRKK
ncbi:hypothetical protein [Tissierella sp. Yu-01]|nr:hypothetical protein [Tissierella sp. Yu-01]WFA10163.1 hypothetical protein P3962_06325 [Tissierella sp. Yu-01]